MRATEIAALLLCLATSACGQEGAVREAAASTVVDSALPREVMLERFRTCCGQVDSLSGGAPSRDALVARFVRALETRDRKVFRDLLLTQAEFAWLYYPTARQSLPPYDLSPQLMWFMLSSHTDKGIGRAEDEYGGKPLGYVDYRCEGEEAVEGENRLWGPCVVRRLAPQGDTVEIRLFGPIIERGGRYKFVSFANKL